MEKLLHYAWQHRVLPATGLLTTDGQPVEVLDPGLHNHHDGPDFFNAKVRIGSTLWAGNVEIHLRASDWYRHGHGDDPRYDSVVLHVVGTADRGVTATDGRPIAQAELRVPDDVLESYRELLAEEHYPPCHRVVARLAPLTVHGWLNALTAERLEEKTARINVLLQRTAGDWERAFFVTLARNFGFGANNEAFEAWAQSLPPAAAGKHRDDAFQVEALFFGQAGLLDDGAVRPERRDDYFLRLQAEYRFLAHKFGLQPIDFRLWRFMRLRPGNFPHIRLAQLAALYHRRSVDFSRIIAAPDAAALKALLSTQAPGYWASHYTFGSESAAAAKALQPSSLDLLLINTVAPMLFAYGRAHFDETLCERAFALLEQTAAEHNRITRSWAAAGITAANAADSQALIRLRHHYCDRKDCLRCRFGAEYLRHRGA